MLRAILTPIRDLRARLRRVKKLPSRAFLLAVGASFAAVFGMTTALGASGDPAGQHLVEEDGQYPATPRIEVDRGTLPGVGGYRLLHSRDHRGGLCVALLLEEQGPSGGPDLSEGCGGPEKLNIGKVTAADGKWTVLNGKAPQEAKTLGIVKADGSTAEVAVVDDNKGIDGGFVVAKLNGPAGDLEIRALDGTGRTLASQRLPD